MRLSSNNLVICSDELCPCLVCEENKFQSVKPTLKAVAVGQNGCIIYLIVVLAQKPFDKGPLSCFWFQHCQIVFIDCILCVYKVCICTLIFKNLLVSSCPLRDK